MVSVARPWLELITNHGAPLSVFSCLSVVPRQRPGKVTPLLVRTVV